MHQSYFLLRLPALTGKKGKKDFFPCTKGNVNGLLYMDLDNNFLKNLRKGLCKNLLNPSGVSHRYISPNCIHRFD